MASSTAWSTAAWSAVRVGEEELEEPQPQRRERRRVDALARRRASAAIRWSVVPAALHRAVGEPAGLGELAARELEPRRRPREGAVGPGAVLERAPHDLVGGAARRRRPGPSRAAHAGRGGVAAQVGVGVHRPAAGGSDLAQPQRSLGAAEHEAVVGRERPGGERRRARRSAARTPSRSPPSSSR